MKEETRQEDQYAITLAHAIADVLSNDENENYIDETELREGDNLTHFIHALSNLLPNLIYTSLTEDQKTMLEFNHLANQLCFQYTEK